jgi:hypothetical protein
MCTPFPQLPCIEPNDHRSEQQPGTSLSKAALYSFQSTSLLSYEPFLKSALVHRSTPGTSTNQPRKNNRREQWKRRGEKIITCCTSPSASASWSARCGCVTRRPEGRGVVRERVLAVLDFFFLFSPFYK